MNKQEMELLKNASAEIKSLRVVNQKQGIRLEAIDDMLLLLNAKQPESRQGFSPDIASQIDRYIFENPQPEAGE